MKIAPERSAEYRSATEIELMAEHLPLEGATVLELGCGAARWTRTLAENFSVKRIIATEVDRVQHQKNLQIQDLPQVEFRYGGAEAIELENQSVDIVIMLKSLHHVPMDQLDQALSEIHRVLKVGGLAYISEPIYAGEFNQILRLFNDEKQVRQAAFAALYRAVERGLFQLERQIFFQSITRIADWADFERRFLFPSHSDHQISPELYQQVKQAFAPYAQGAEFINPHRVDLLRKPSD